jgi:REP-associated tyrosine transposase
MSDYRRWYVPGGSYFFTIVTHRRQGLLGTPESVERLRAALRSVQSQWPFDVVAAVVLPDHMHFIWTLPPGDAGYSRRIGRMKALFSSRRDSQSADLALVSASRRKHREREPWQRRFWEHALRDEDDLKRHLDYIHYNPVKYGYVRCPHLWSYSSFMHWVVRGEYETGWGCQCRGQCEEPVGARNLEASTGEP